MKKISIPIYNLDNDEWNLILDHAFANCFFININSDGLVNFAEGDEDYGQFCLYSPNELNDFVNILPIFGNIQNESTNLFKEFQLDKIVDLYLLLPGFNTNSLTSIDSISKVLPKELFNKLMKGIFDLNDFAENTYYSLNQYIKENSLTDKLEFISISNIPVLVNENSTYINSDSAIIDMFPYLGFKIKNEFSTQFLFDYFKNSIDGKILFEEIKESLLNHTPFNKLKIKAPKDKISQIKYSAAFRLQYEAYKYDTSKISNHINEQIRDLKELYKVRRKVVHKFIHDKKIFNFLDTLRNPLPYNIEKSYRSYLRSADDIDRLTLGGKLYNLILRSIIFYPLEEIIYLGFDTNEPNISEIIRTIKDNKPISDGTWVELFNKLATVIYKNENIELKYFGSFIRKVNKTIIPILRDMVPPRNDVHHYREHFTVWLKLLDSNLPIILDAFRNAFSDSLIIQIINQNYKKDGLYIKAKKIMGYEVDIETIEFSTALNGKYFIENELIVYNKTLDYTVPLNNFFKVEIIKSDSIKMGIIGNFINGVPTFDY
ncbi:hypothetical protein [Runella sp.]|uniref:hypothetical protein n=1 Tax=Runella sp. TaxID=1960881 RepID=UPI0026280765|nr:hypothetical protein [Runella sp.]